jgi:hypothetical protein
MMRFMKCSVLVLAALLLCASVSMAQIRGGRGGSGNMVLPTGSSTKVVTTRTTQVIDNKTDKVVEIRVARVIDTKVTQVVDTKTAQVINTKYTYVIDTKVSQVITTKVIVNKVIPVGAERNPGTERFGYAGRGQSHPPVCDLDDPLME